MNVTFVDHQSNLTFKNGDVDASAFHTDSIHLSASGVDRMLSDLSLHKQISKRQRHERARRSAFRVDESARISTTRINRDPRQVNESNQRQQRQRHVRRSTDRDVMQEITRDDTQRDDNEWRVVSRRRSTQDRRTSGQCAARNVVNLNTSIPGANTLDMYNVECRQCGQLSHKEKHHAWD